MVVPVFAFVPDPVYRHSITRSESASLWFPRQTFFANEQVIYKLQAFNGKAQDRIPSPFLNTLQGF